MTMPTPQWAYQTPVKPSSGDTFWLWRCSHCRRLDRSHWSFSLFLVSFWHSDPFYLFLARRNSFSGRYESFYICNEAGKPQISYTLYFFKVLEPALRKRSKAVIPGLTPGMRLWSLKYLLTNHFKVTTERGAQRSFPSNHHVAFLRAEQSVPAYKRNSRLSEVVQTEHHVMVQCDCSH